MRTLLILAALFSIAACSTTQTAQTTTSASSGGSMQSPMSSPVIHITLKEGEVAQGVLNAHHEIIISSIQTISASENKVMCKLACTKAEVAGLKVRLEMMPQVLKVEEPNALGSSGG